MMNFDRDFEKNFEREYRELVYVRERVMRKIVKDSEKKFDEILSEDKPVNIKHELQNIIREGIKTYSKVMGRPITKAEIYMMFG
jgi:hypothetical protein